MKKILLIFNTSLDSPHDPIYVIDPRKFGVEPDTQIPIVLAYNMSHYESVHPADKSDEEKSVNLVNQYFTGSYMYGKKDLPFLLHLENKIIETHKPEVVSQFNEEDKHVGKDIFLKSLPDHLKGKRPRDMTKEEKKEYDAKRKKFSRNSKNKTIIERTEEEKDLAKEKDRERKEKARNSKSKADKLQKERDKQTKKLERGKKSEEEDKLNKERDKNRRGLDREKNRAKENELESNKRKERERNIKSIKEQKNCHQVCIWLEMPERFLSQNKLSQN